MENTSSSIIGDKKLFGAWEKLYVEAGTVTTKELAAKLGVLVTAIDGASLYRVGLKINDDCTITELFQ